MRGSKTCRAGTALVTLLLVAVACSGDAAEVTPTPTLSPTPTPTPTVATTCPLTGEDPPARVDITRPAVAIKVEDSPAARPQSGLEHADLVFEEIVEGGITRFMAIYHCDDSTKVGPVRSARFDDPKIGKPFTRILIYSGANSIVKRELDARGMIALEELDISGPALYRDPPGTLFIHGLFANTEEIRKLPQADRARPPARVFDFGPIEGRATKARFVKVNFTAANTIEWRWQGKSWRRFEAGQSFLAGTGEQIAVPNVLVQEVEVNHSPTIVDSAGNPSPDIDLEGSGRAFLFRGGKVIRATWTFSSRRRAPVFKTKAGEPLFFEPGPIWVELVPSKTGQVKGSIAFN